MYHTLIVGAGSAGAVLAARLTEDPARSVLLLEAGPDYPDLDALPEDLKYGYGPPSGILARSHNWNYTARLTGIATNIPIPRGRVTGGSSAVNAQIFLRGLPDDFARWGALGNDLWSFDHVLPYYQRIETDHNFSDPFHGADGPVPVRRYGKEEWRPDQLAFYTACRDAGFPDCPDLNRPDAGPGTGPYPINNRDRIRISTALAYLNPARNRPNLTILPNCAVHRILFDGARATGVLASTRGATQTFAADEIVLAAGAIGSPHLLMCSGVGPESHLKSLDIPLVAHLPGVGRNLRDHPAVDMSWRLRPGHTVDDHTHWHQVGLRYTSDGSGLASDMIVYVAALANSRELLVRPTVNLALGSGELALTSPDPDAPPALDYRLFEHPADLTRIREGVRLCLELAAHPAFGPILESPLEPAGADLASNAALDRWIARRAATGHHVSCTCKMGPPSDPLAVVDQAGAVHGLRNLRIVDASIMPDCVRANINATVIMLAERIADLLR